MRKSLIEFDRDWYVLHPGMGQVTTQVWVRVRCVSYILKVEQGISGHILQKQTSKLLAVIGTTKRLLLHTERLLRTSVSYITNKPFGIQVGIQQIAEFWDIFGHWLCIAEDRWIHSRSGHSSVVMQWEQATLLRIAKLTFHDCFKWFAIWTVRQAICCNFDDANCH